VTLLTSLTGTEFELPVTVAAKMEMNQLKKSMEIIRRNERLPGHTEKTTIDVEKGIYQVVYLKTTTNTTNERIPRKTRILISVQAV
jgi:hypothetical protein